MTARPQMAPCTACGHSISTHAFACPQCGHPSSHNRQFVTTDLVEIPFIDWVFVITKVAIASIPAMFLVAAVLTGIAMALGISLAALAQTLTPR